MNPFAPRPPMPHGQQYYGGGPRPFQQPMGAASSMMPRPGPMRIFENQVIDMRENNTDTHGRFLPLHDEDPDKFEV
eukprot:1575026-Pyramimonas_sp.AAC.1